MDLDELVSQRIAAVLGREIIAKVVAEAQRDAALEELKRVKEAAAHTSEAAPGA